MNEQSPQNIDKGENLDSIDQKLQDQMIALKPLFAAFVEKPVGKNDKALRAALNQNVDTMEAALEMLKEDKSDQEYFYIGMTYIRGYEQMRVDILNDVTNTKDYEISISIADDDTFEQLAESQYPIDNVLYNIYNGVLGVQMEKFEENCQDAYEEKPSTQRMEKMKIVGSHALDVAKIGVGVVLGVAIAKRSKLL